MKQLISKTVAAAGIRFTPVADATIRRDLQTALTTAELVLAERFLFGDEHLDPISAHSIVKAIHACGEDAYSSLWEHVVRYVQSAEYHMLEKLSALPPAVPQPHPFKLSSIALHCRSESYVKVHSLQLDYIHFRNATIDAAVHQDHWQKFLQPV